MKTKIILSAVAVWALGLAPQASAVVAVTQPGSTATGYTAPVVVTVKGETVTYANFDIDVHDIRSNDNRPAGSASYCVLSPDACPLFYSDLLEIGQSGLVYGTNLLPAGTYGFYCSWHTWMKGSLVVQG